MPRQVDRDLGRVSRVAALQALGHAAVPHAAARRWNQVVQHLFVQGVNEFVATRCSRIRPNGGPGGA